MDKQSVMVFAMWTSAYDGGLIPELFLSLSLGLSWTVMVGRAAGTSLTKESPGIWLAPYCPSSGPTWGIAFMCSRSWATYVHMHILSLSCSHTHTVHKSPSNFTIPLLQSMMTATWYSLWCQLEINKGNALHQEHEWRLLEHLPWRTGVNIGSITFELLKLHWHCHIMGTFMYLLPKLVIRI